MIRTLLATTALALVITSPALSQDAAPATEQAPSTEMSTETDVNTGAAQTTEINQPWDMSAGYVSADTDNLATRLIDQPVYSSTGDDAEEIGNISDLVFSEQGEINAVIIDVGGFIGIGQKSVAVDFGALEFTLAADNTERWVLPTTADALTAAPEFVWREDEPTGITDNNALAPAANDPGTPSTTEVAPVDNLVAPMPGIGVREGQTVMDMADLTADNITGSTVVGPDGDDIAEVGDILLTDDGSVDAMLIDFGGFLGLGQKRVAVGMDNIQFASDANGALFVYTNFTREQLEQQPEFNEQTYAAERDTQRMVAQ